jgi:hypothetical protein
VNLHFSLHPSSYEFLTPPCILSRVHTSTVSFCVHSQVIFPCFFMFLTETWRDRSNLYLSAVQKSVYKPY